MSHEPNDPKFSRRDFLEVSSGALAASTYRTFESPTSASTAILHFGSSAPGASAAKFSPASHASTNYGAARSSNAAHWCGPLKRIGRLQPTTIGCQTRSESFLPRFIRACELRSRMPSRTEDKSVQCGTGPGMKTMRTDFDHASVGRKISTTWMLSLRVSKRDGCFTDRNLTDSGSRYQICNQ